MADQLWFMTCIREEEEEEEELVQSSRLIQHLSVFEQATNILYRVGVQAAGGVGV